MNEDVPDLPSLIDEMKARLEVVEQVLRLRVPQRHGHPRDPQAVPSALHHPHQRPGGHCSCRWCALLAATTRWTSSVGIARPGRQSVMKILNVIQIQTVSVALCCVLV